MSLFETLTEPIKGGLTTIAIDLLKMVTKTGYDAAKLKISAGRILANSWTEFRKGYLKDAQDDSILFNIYKGFYQDKNTKRLYAKVYEPTSETFYLLELNKGVDIHNLLTWPQGNNTIHLKLTILDLLKQNEVKKDG